MTLRRRPRHPRSRRRLVLLNPAETNKVDARILDVSLVEEFNNLGTNVSPQIAALRPCQVCRARKLAETA
jgi:hypothetical protein